MGLVTVSSKGQITLPAKIRKGLGIRSKDKVQLIVRNNQIIIKPHRSFRELRGILASKKGNPRKTIHDAAARHVMDMELID